jgi:hypothetical protein
MFLLLSETHQLANLHHDQRNKSTQSIKRHCAAFPGLPWHFMHAVCEAAKPSWDELGGRELAAALVCAAQQWKRYAPTTSPEQKVGIEYLHCGHNINLDLLLCRQRL